MKPLAQFRVYPDEQCRNLYFRVKIFRTLTQLRDYHAKLGYGRCNNMDAFCAGITKYRVRKGQPDRCRPLVGEIGLALPRLGSSVVAHECVHATLRWMRRKEIDIDLLTELTGERGGGIRQDSAEERACYSVGGMCRQIYARSERAGLIKCGEPIKQ